MEKSKYIHTYKNKRGLFIEYVSIYEYRGYKYSVVKTGVSHVDKYSHDMNKSQIDNIIKHKESGSKMTESAQDSLDKFFDLTK